MGTFTNIARNIYNMACSGADATVTKDFTALQLYEQGTICIYSTKTSSECFCHVSNFTTTPLVSGHKYYACYWAKTSSGTYSTDLFIGNSIDSENDHIVGPITVGTSWTRCSGILIPSDTGSGADNARIDFNNNGTRYNYMYFSGFLLVDLTNAGIPGKSQAWCDDHLYWVQENAQGSYTDYDAEGTGSFASSGAPWVSTLATYHNYAANKSNRGGATVSVAPATASASWINTVYNAQVAMTTKGNTYGTCAVVRTKPSNFRNITAPAAGSKDFYTSGRSVVNNLIANADALYAQTYCVQASLKYTEHTCNPYNMCSNCCNSDCCDSNRISWHFSYCRPVCVCESVGACGCNATSSYCNSYCCDSVCYCEMDEECCNEDCGEDSSCTECSETVCGCNSVCSCNWV